MEIELKLPSLGKDAPNEATVSFFYASEGEAVKQGEDFVEMVTDKATFNVPAEASGVVKKILVKENEKIKVGQPIAIIETK